MSRVAKQPIEIPGGVQVNGTDGQISVRGPKGTLELNLHPSVVLDHGGDQITMVPENDDALAMAGTMRALLNNMVTGVSKGFEKKLQLVGVGYRAQMQGNALNLTLGFSHPVNLDVPEGITIETPSQTEIVITGADKQKVGQIAAVIRAYRPPEPYKGKGVRYAGEHIVRKEAKKA
jgi:large subunit ribosomal protein L6